MAFCKQKGNDTLLYNSSDTDMTIKQIDTAFKALQIYRDIKVIKDSTPLFAICEHRTINGKSFTMCYLTKRYNLKEAKNDDEGAIVYIGSCGGIGYKTKGNRISDTSPINETIAKAIKLYPRSKIKIVSMSVAVEVDENVSNEELKRLIKRRCKYGSVRRATVILDE